MSSNTPGDESPGRDRIEELEQRVDMLEDNLPDGVTRREALQLGGAVGVGSLLGGGGAYAASQPARAAPSTSDSDGDIGTPSDRWDVYADGIDARSISTDEQNNVHYIDPDTSDWGQAVNDLLPSVPTGGVIATPPGDYDLSTTAAPGKSVIITCPGTTGFEQGATITKQADVKMVEPAASVDIGIFGHAFDSAISDTTVGIELHGYSVIRDCSVENQGSDGIYLHQQGTNDNLNRSVVENIRVAYNSGDGVALDNTSGEANNVNGVKVHVRDHFDNTGWGINNRNGHGNVLRVQVAEGSNQNGGIRLGYDNCFAILDFAETTTPVGIQFDGSQCVGYARYNNATNAYVANSANNLYRSEGGGAAPFVSSGWEATHIHGGIDIQDSGIRSVPGTWRGNTRVTSNGWGRAPEDLSAISGHFSGQLATHDGSDANSTPAGVYRWDGTAWVKVEDNTITI